METTVDKHVEDILTKVHGKEESPEMDLQTLELAKIIVQKLFDPANLHSLSLLSSEQVEDITNAYLLNEYFQLPEIDNYIENYLSLKRSTAGFMVHQLTKLGTIQTFEEPAQNKGFLSSVFRR